VSIPGRTRRILILAAAGAGLVGLLLALSAVVLALDDAAMWIVAGLVLLALAVAAELALLVAGEAEAFDEAGEWHDWEAQAATPAGELVLRCAGCGETFTMADTGARPLTGACPHCGQSGVLRGEPVAERPPAPHRR